MGPGCIYNLPKVSLRLLPGWWFSASKNHFLCEYAHRIGIQARQVIVHDHGVCILTWPGRDPSVPSILLYSYSDSSPNVQTHVSLRKIPVPVLWLHSWQMAYVFLGKIKASRCKQFSWSQRRYTGSSCPAVASPCNAVSYETAKFVKTLTCWSCTCMVF